MKDYGELRKSLPVGSRTNFDAGLEQLREALESPEPLKQLAALWRYWTDVFIEMMQPKPALTPAETLEIVSFIAKFPGPDQMKALDFLGKHHGLIVERRLTANKTETTIRVVYDTAEPLMDTTEPVFPLLEGASTDD